MSRYAFLLTSAINTKFGVYDSVSRLNQTLDTITSIRERAPSSPIYLLEMAAIPLTAEQREKLLPKVDQFLDFSSDPGVVGLYNSTDNWDVVKNVTEVQCFQNALKKLYVDTRLLSKHQRLFKISGRYQLTDQFDLKYYDQYANENMIVVSKSRGSQFDIKHTGVERQFMSRLWSWPSTLTPEIIKVYENSLKYMYERLVSGGYVDIEHSLYKFLDHDKILEKEFVGICGNVAPIGAKIED